MNAAIQNIVNEIKRTKKVTDEQIRETRAVLYADGKVSREEAEILFQMNDQIENPPHTWQTFFADAVSDHVLKDDSSPGKLDGPEAVWVREKIEKNGSVDASELRLLGRLIRGATEVPAEFSAWALNAAVTSILKDGEITDDETASLRDIVFGEGGSGGAKVSVEERDALVRLRDGAKTVQSGFNAFFAEAMRAYVLEDGHIDDTEATWMTQHVFHKADGAARETAKLLSTAKMPAGLQSVVKRAMA